MESIANAGLPSSGGGGILGSVPIVIPPPPQLPIVNAIPVCWIPPPPGYIKINTDGCVRGRTSGASSCGGVFRDFRGFVVKSFSLFLGYNMSALEAEMIGVIVAINTAYFILRLGRVWLECDSLQTVALIQAGIIDDRIPESIRGRWRGAMELMQLMDTRVTHIYREGNTVADKLANYAIETKVPISSWNTIPDFIVNETNLDAMGHTYFRVKGRSF